VNAVLADTARRLDRLGVTKWAGVLADEGEER